MLVKEQVIEQINNLPQEFTLQEVIEKLQFLEKLQNRLKESETDEIINAEELEKEIEKW